MRLLVCGRFYDITLVAIVLPSLCRASGWDLDIPKTWALLQRTHGENKCLQKIVRSDI